MAKAMTPHTVKKRRELQGVLDYFQDKLTGDEFVQMMNSEVASGQRTGKLREKERCKTHTLQGSSRIAY